MWAISVIKKTAQSQQSQTRRKFAQSGHPGENIHYMDVKGPVHNACVFCYWESSICLCFSRADGADGLRVPDGAGDRGEVCGRLPPSEGQVSIVQFLNVRKNIFGLNFYAELFR
jgi:hypothetical protein